jgi:hypothetical protein
VTNPKADDGLAADVVEGAVIAGGETRRVELAAGMPVDVCRAVLVAAEVSEGWGLGALVVVAVSAAGVGFVPHAVRPMLRARPIRPMTLRQDTICPV